MCVSEVGRVIGIRDGAEADVDVDGRERRVSLVALGLDAPSPMPGDWLLLHTGFAIEVLDQAEALGLAALAREARTAGERA